LAAGLLDGVVEARRTHDRTPIVEL